MAGYYRKVLRITAADSPNVRYALAEVAKGLSISNRIVVPGVLSWTEYEKRRATWDKVRQTIGLDAQFYEGAEVLLFPPDWIDEAHRRHQQLRAAGEARTTKAVACDPGEGVANTAFAAVDELGVVEVVGRVIQDSMDIVDSFIAFIKRHKVPDDRILIDRGGGGYQLASVMRRKGHNIRTIAFGEAIALPPKAGSYLPKHRRLLAEQKYAYTNRRAQMYGDLNLLLDPSMNPEGYGIPEEYQELRKQMAPIPKYYDSEGRLIIPPKHRKPGQKEATMKTLEELIGHSPDELDAVCLAIHGMLYDDSRPKVGPMWDPATMNVGR